MTVKNITVVGAGTMGSGIAHTFGQCGFAVQLYDLNTSQLQQAKSNIEKNLSRQVKKGTLSETEKNNSLGNICLTRIYLKI